MEQMNQTTPKATPDQTTPQQSQQQSLPQGMPQGQQRNSQQPTGPVCPRDCRKCLQSQRIYCASQHALSNMYVLDKVVETLFAMKGQTEALQGAVQELSAKIEAIQNSEAAVFDPSGGMQEQPREGSGDVTEQFVV